MLTLSPSPAGDPATSHWALSVVTLLYVVPSSTTVAPLSIQKRLTASTFVNELPCTHICSWIEIEVKCVLVVLPVLLTQNSIGRVQCMHFVTTTQSQELSLYATFDGCTVALRAAHVQVMCPDC